MNAVQIIEYGDSRKAEINRFFPDPVPKKGQILIEVHDASINPFDIKLRSGMYENSISMKLPYVPGSDFSGVVIGVAEDVDEFKKEDEVFGSASVLNGGSGTFAEFCVANTQNTVLKPESQDHYYTASLPLVGCSAIQALEDHIDLKNGQKILIHGAAGGIGSIAMQIAKHIGAYIAVTVSTEDIEFTKDLGADQVINYKDQDFTEHIKDFDAVLDTVGGDTTKKSFRIIKKGGILVSMLGEPDQKLAGKHGIKAIGQSTKTDTAHLSRLASLVDEGVVKPQVEKIFPMDEIRQAFDYFENGSPRGKVVIKIKK